MAQAQLERAFGDWRALGDPTFVPLVLLMQAWLWRDVGDVTRARLHVANGLSLWPALPPRLALAILEVAAEVATLSGEPEPAGQLRNAIARFSQKYGPPLAIFAPLRRMYGWSKRESAHQLSCVPHPGYVRRFAGGRDHQCHIGDVQPTRHGGTIVLTRARECRPGGSGAQ